MKRLLLIFVLLVFLYPQIGYADEKGKCDFNPFYGIEENVVYIELQSGTSGKFKYILEQKQIEMIQNAFKTIKYIESSKEELNDRKVGGFRYVVTFYCADGSGYRFNKEKNYVTTGSFNGVQRVIKLNDENDQRLDTFLEAIYESVEDSTVYKIPVIQMMNRTIDVRTSNHQLEFRDLHNTNLIKNIPAYSYANYNYFKLRDISKILGYSVKWDYLRNEVILIKDERYQELTTLPVLNKAESAYISSQTIRVENREGNIVYYARGCINIDGYNYFKLRDLETIMDFKCNWNPDLNTVIICVDK